VSETIVALGALSLLVGAIMMTVGRRWLDDAKDAQKKAQRTYDATILMLQEQRDRLDIVIAQQRKDIGIPWIDSAPTATDRQQLADDAMRVDIERCTCPQKPCPATNTHVWRPNPDGSYGARP
jgi:hypothetical protein